MDSIQHPALYQINTRISLSELATPQKPSPTLDEISNKSLERIADLGFNWIWLLGIWQTGPIGRRISREPQWSKWYQDSLPDMVEDDICGSPFAVKAYRVHEDFGGPQALERLRHRMRKYGLKLMLDFMPNHTGHDHAWVHDHPEFYIQGDAEHLAREPHNYCQIETKSGPVIFAHGRDPYFPGWTDTLQLNYRHAGFRAAMQTQLQKIATLCDGVRCDMAMLILPEVIARTWGSLSDPRDGTAPLDTCFWPEATARVHAAHAHFIFLAEVYWDLEWELQQQGFDFTYDKKLYDLLRARNAAGVRGHLHADPNFLRKCAHFLENHDEPRTAHEFPFDQHQAAAVITFLIPGMRFIYEGQLEGRRDRAVIHLRRRTVEQANVEIEKFYERLLACVRRPEVRGGAWNLLDCRSAWEGNATHEGFVAGGWRGTKGEFLLTVTNYSPQQGQCCITLPVDDVEGRTYRLHDLLNGPEYDRTGHVLTTTGLYVDLPAWGNHLFEIHAL